MKEVAFIIERPTPQRAPVLDQLTAMGLPIRVVYLHGSPAEQGWGDIPLNHPHVFADTWDRRQRSQFTKDIRHRRYGTLVSMGYRGSIRTAALTAARLASVPVAMRFDTNQLQIEATRGPKRMLRRRAMRSLIPPQATAWAIGEQNERFWRDEIGLRSIVSIPYEVPVLPGSIPAVEVTRARTSDVDNLRFLYVGRLAEIKRVADAISAFRAVTEPTWTLHIVGDGPQRARLESMASGDDRISFAGSMTYADLGSTFEGSDVLILPSSGEPWGLVVNEALGFGLRVIASDQIGAAYDLLDEASGEMYPVGDTQALAAAIRRSREYPHQDVRHPATDTAALMASDLHRLAGS